MSYFYFRAEGKSSLNTIKLSQIHLLFKKSRCNLQPEGSYLAV